jgi:NAD(P)H-flavin reductase
MQSVVIPWIAPTIFMFYLDFGIRFYTKFMLKSHIVSMELVSKDILKLELKRDGFFEKKGLLDWEPGSYVWLSVHKLKTKKSTRLPIPSWACFHPFTITSPPTPG